MIFRFCPFCGFRMESFDDEGKKRPKCSHCGYIQYRNPTVGVAVIIIQEGKLLLVKRAGSYRDRWCIPCGHVEWDEEIRETAKRELLEETGLEAEIGDVFDVHSNFHDPNHQTVGIWFRGEIIGGKIKAGSDSSEVKFFDLDDLPLSSMAFPTDLLVCEKLRREAA